jgi:hypothetical protein
MDMMTDTCTGTTEVTKSDEREDVRRQSITALAKDYQCFVEQTGEKYAPKGYLTKLIDEKMEEFGLPAD